MSDLARKQIPRLSKSRFLAGLQCRKRLYLECFQRDLSDPVDEGQQALFDVGTQIGELARDLYPGGVLIGDDYLHHNNAVASTKKVLSDPHTPAIYEGGFIHDDVRIRADILVRVGDDLFDLIEVKSGTKVKGEHLWDVGIQIYVLKGCGIAVRRACLARLDKEYVYPGGDYNLSELFSVEDITDKVQGLQSDIPPLLREMRLALGGSEAPDIVASRHCSQPYTCPFYDLCHIGETEHHVGQLPRAGRELLRSLEEAGIEDIREIPAGFPGLNEIHWRVRDCVVNNRVHLDHRLPKALGQLEYPIHYLDFETFNPALPLYAGTRPYQMIPFQWSNHILAADGELRHEEFLHDGFDDPRKLFAESLLKTLGTTGSVAVYSSFEAARIRELAAFLPDLSVRLRALLDGRIVDLLQIVREYCYHPGFHGSFSLKSVLPALAPDFSYNDLEICEGGMASVAYMEMIQTNTSPGRRDSLRKNLLAYCKRDTEAEVRLLETLRGGTLPGNERNEQ